MVYSILLFVRLVCISVTLLPHPNSAYSNHERPESLQITFSGILNALFTSIKCDDLIFSGRAVALIIPAMTHHHYIGGWMVYVFWIITTIGCLLLILSKYNYTVDVVVAFYLTCSIYWAYTAIAERKYMFSQLKIFKWFFTKMEWYSEISCMCKNE